MKTIKDVEKQVQVQISPLLKELGLMPTGYECAVRLYGESRKKKQTAPLEKNWHPETDSIKVEFTLTAKMPAAAKQQAEHQTADQPTSSLRSVASDPTADLVRALDRAESRPGYKFVALKWFRDTALLSEGFSWTTGDSARKTVLSEAIDNKLVLTSSVRNPNSPYPTTAIRLNRLMPQVQAILGIENTHVPEFAPLPIRGENLSATILRDRR